MLDLNQRPPPCKFGQSISDRFYPVGKSSLFKQFLPFLAALFSCSVRVRPAPVAAWLQHLPLLRPVEVGLRRRRRICSAQAHGTLPDPRRQTIPECTPGFNGRGCLDRIKHKKEVPLRLQAIIAQSTHAGSSLYHADISSLTCSSRGGR